MKNESDGRMLSDAVAQADSIAIAGHIRPDGDCVGACLGLYNYLQENYNRSFEKEITVYMKDIPEAFLFLKNSGKPLWEFEQEKQYDLFIVLDCSSEDRLGDALKYFKSAKHTLCFDHHISNSGHFTDGLVLHADYSSTCEVLFTCMQEEKISLAAAEALYLGIVHDTGVFKHSNTSEQTMRIAGRLLGMGVDSTRVIDGTFYEKSYIENQILGRCLMESMLVLDGRVILSYLSHKTMRLYVSKTAVFFGGGGHKKAAGYEAHGFMHDVINNLLAGLCHQLKE